jgi:hypothetical protein
MPPTGPQSQKLRDALVAGFTATDLEQVVPFDLVNGCGARGRSDELLAMIAKARPDNRAVGQMVAELRAELGPPPT